MMGANTLGVSLVELCHVYKAFKKIAMYEYTENKSLECLSMLNQLRNILLQMLLYDGLWIDAQSKAEEVVDMLQWPEGAPDEEDCIYLVEYETPTVDMLMSIS